MYTFNSADKQKSGLFGLSFFMLQDPTYDFIRSFSDIEIKMMRDYFKMSLASTSAELETAKYIKLFEAIIDEKLEINSEKQLAEIVGTKNLTSLKYILVNKIEDAFMLEKNIENNSLLENIAKDGLALQKKALFLFTLFRLNHQKRIDFTFHLFNDIINTAKKRESYSILVELLYFYKNNRGLRLGIEEYERISAEFNFYQKCLDLLRFATDCYNRIVLNTDLIKYMSPAEQITFLKKSIKYIEKENETVKSMQVFYYLQILKFALNEDLGKYKEALKQCEHLVEALKSSEVIYSKMRMGYAHDNLSLYSAHLKKFKKAVAYSQEAQKYFEENTFAYLISKESEFKIYFYAGDFAKATAVLRKIANHSLSNSGSFRKSKFDFYQACILFAQQKFKDVLEITRTKMEIEKDKSGWNIYLRLLNIMTLIELDKFDETVAALEAMRKYKERFQSEKEAGITERHWIICDLLKEWEKSGFSSKVDNKNILASLTKLGEVREAYSWKLFSNELIPFHNWMEGRIKGKVKSK